MTYEESIAQLNPQQAEAANEMFGRIRVVAGAGAGKTKTLACRYAKLVREGGVPEENILCVTFTNKAAGEMKQRIRGLLGSNSNGLVKTFHGFCLDIIKRDANKIGWPKSFGILEQEETEDLVRRMLHDCGIRDVEAPGAGTTVQKMLKAVLRSKLRRVRGMFPYLDDFLALSEKRLESEYRRIRDSGMRSDKDLAAACYNGLLLAQRHRKCLEFSDFLPMAMKLLMEHEDIRTYWQERLLFIMVDEFQDVDENQFELVKLLSQGSGNLFVVGDPDQTIYAFRGAKPEYFVNFDREFNDVKTISLDKNYRSTPQIVGCANSLIEKNTKRIPKTLEPVQTDGDSVICHVAKTKTEEANWIVEKLKALHAGGVPWSAMAILAASTKSTIFAAEDMALSNAEVPFDYYGKDKFYQKRDVKTVLAYFRLVADRKDDDAFRRCVNVPDRHVGRPMMERMQAWAEENDGHLYDAFRALSGEPDFAEADSNGFFSVFEGLSENPADEELAVVAPRIFETSGIEAWLRTGGDEDRLDDLAELESRIQKFAAAYGQKCVLQAFLDHVEEEHDGETHDDRDTVKCMTIHASKGLEFDYVFFCLLNEGLIPNAKSNTLDSLEEDRRKAFVAMTRAKRKLFLSASRGTPQQSAQLSRFLFEINRSLIQFEPPMSDEEWNCLKPHVVGAKGPGGPAFRSGDRVLGLFGHGEILEPPDENGRVLVRFDIGGQTIRIQADRLRPEGASGNR